VDKGRLSCDSEAPQVGGARFDWARVVKVNRRKTNRRKTRTYCTDKRFKGKTFISIVLVIGPSFKQV